MNYVEKTWCNIDEFVDFLRKFALFDILVACFFKIINYFCQYFNSHFVIAYKFRSTTSQRDAKNKFREIAEEIGYDHTIIVFSQTLSKFIHNKLKQEISQILFDLPEIYIIRYIRTLSLPLWYLCRQVSKNIDVHKIIQNKVGFKIKFYFVKFCLYIAQLISDKNNVNMVLNFEYITVDFLSKLKKNHFNKETLVFKVVQIFDCILVNHNKSLLYVSSLGIESDKDKLICIIDWYSKNYKLPQSLPNPLLVNSKNLDVCIKNSLEKYCKIRVKIILNKIYTNKKYNFSNLIYLIEGKDFLVDIFTNLLVNNLVQQLVDPDLFAINILNSANIETMSFEQNVFDFNHIFTVAEQILNNIDNNNIDTIYDVVNNTILQSTEGVESIKRKRCLKNSLTSYISNIIYKSIKNNKNDNPLNYLKSIKKSTQNIPVVGMTTGVLNFMINCCFFSLSYIANNSKNNESFYKWMFSSLHSKEMANKLAIKIVEFIYSPQWIINVLFLFEFLIDTFLDDDSNIDSLFSENDNTLVEKTDKCIKNIIYSTFVYFFYKSSPNDSVSKIVKTVSTKNIATTLINFFENQTEKKYRLPVFDQSLFVNKLLFSIIPSLNENCLIVEMINTSRSYGCFFDNDQHFWDIFIRQYINKVDKHNQKIHVDKIDCLQYIDIKYLIETLNLISYFKQTTFNEPVRISIFNNAELSKNLISVYEPDNI